MRPLVLLAVAVVTGLGMWRLLMDDPASDPSSPEQLSRHDARIESSAQR